MVLADSLADALYPKAMPMLIGLMGGQAALVLALETITILAYSLVKSMITAYNKNTVFQLYDLRGDDFMALAEAVKTSEDSYTIENAMNALLSKLDEALDDVEQGRVLDETELWAEIDAI